MTKQSHTRVQLWEFINKLADQLGETQRGPRAQVARIVKGAGVDLAQELYQLTLETEAQGGLMLPDGSRRRTPGGVFFYLARLRLSEELLQTVFPRRRKSPQTTPQPSAVSATFP